MKTALALTFVFGALAFADGNQGLTGDPGVTGNQGNQTTGNQTLADGTAVKRVGSITWNGQTGKLEWSVQSGVMRDGKFDPSSEEAHYEITPEQAMMAFEGKQRGFTDQEATWLQGLLHVLTVYCAESTMWWDQGLGTPMDHGKPTAEPADSENPPQKVINFPPKKTPGAVRLIALNQIQ